MCVCVNAHVHTELFQITAMHWNKEKFSGGGNSTPEQGQYRDVST